MTWSTLFDTRCKVDGMGITILLHTETDSWFALDACECDLCGYQEPSGLWGVGLVRIVAYDGSDISHDEAMDNRCVNVCPKCLKSIIRGDFDDKRMRQLVAEHKTIEDFIYDAAREDEAWMRTRNEIRDRINEAFHYTYLGVSAIHPHAGPLDNGARPCRWAQDFMAALHYEKPISVTEFFVRCANHMLSPSIDNPNGVVGAISSPWKIVFDTLARPGIPGLSVGIAILRHDEGAVRIVAYTSGDDGYTYIKKVLDLQSDMIYAAAYDAFEAVNEKTKRAMLESAEEVRWYIIKHPYCTVDHMVRDNPAWQKESVIEHVSTLVRCELIEPNIIEGNVVWYSVHDDSGDGV